MDFKFSRSLVVMGQLARETARTPPAEDNPPLEYVDRSLTVLGRTFDTHNQKIQQEFLGQRKFIASEISEVEKRMDERFKKVDERFQQVDERFDAMEKRMDERFKQVDERFKKMDERFDKQDSVIRDIKVQLDNSAAITRNGRLRRMHQPINLISVLKPGAERNTFVWASHPQFPKHMKATYILAQQAKGIFEPGWDATPKAQQAQAQRKALRTINELAEYYNVWICSDYESESDATEVMLQDMNVDEFMDPLLAEWGMDWQKVLKLKMQHMQHLQQIQQMRSEQQQAGVKRPAADASNTGETTKKTRGGREEEEAD